MKRKTILTIFAWILCSMLGIFTAPAKVYAEESQAIWEYEIYGEGVAVTKYNGTAADIFVPSTISVDGEEKKVLKLGDGLFENNDALNSVTLANGIAEIGARVFYDADNLVCIVTNETLATIGNEAFYSCDNFNSVILYDAVTGIGTDAFAQCPKVTVWCNSNSEAYTYAVNNGIPHEIMDPAAEPEIITVDGLTYYIMNGQAIAIDCDDSVTEVIVPLVMEGYPVVLRETFKDCSNLVSVILPEGMTEIGDYLFENCGSLTTVNIPEGVTRIGNWTFRYCTALKEIEFPGSVTEIGEEAFLGAGIKELEIPEGVAKLSASLFLASAIEKITIPGTIKEIDTACFLNCSKLTQVVLEEGIEIIGQTIFEGCSNLLEVIIPESVISMQTNAFTSNMVLRVHENSYAHSFAEKNGFLYVLFDGNTESIIKTNDGLKYCIINNQAVIIDCDDTLTEVTVPLTVEGYSVVLKETFRDCSGLVKVSLPEGITELGDYLFENCGSLTTVNIPEGVTRIGYAAFRYCWALEEIDLPESMEEAGNDAFCCTGLKKVEIPSELTKLSHGMFSCLAGMEEVTIPGTVKEIDAACFSVCANLTTVILEEGIETIGQTVFERCDKLLQMVIPQSVTSMEANAFPAGMIFLVYENSYAHTFAKENGFLYFLYDGETEPEIVTIDGLTYFIANEQAVAIDCDDTVTDVTVPAMVKGYPVILKETFKECRNLLSVTLPEEITELGDYLFDACTCLTSINIPESVTKIGYATFRDCWALEEIKLPDGLEEVGGDAFAYTGIKTIEIPESLSKLSSSMFFASEIEGITIPGTVKEIDSACFMSCYGLKTVVLEEGIEILGQTLFEGCTSLRQLVIPKSVTSMEKNAYTYPANIILLVAENSYAHTFAVDNNLLYFVLQKSGNPEIAFGASITGTAYYTDGTPAEGATVDILYDDGTLKESVVVESDGSYEFTYAEVGAYTIRVKDTNGNSAMEAVAVTRMNAFDVFVMGDTALKLKKGYGVSGTYTSGDGATVSLTDGEGNVIMQMESTDGSFAFADVQNGTYVLTVEAESGSGSAEITVYGADITDISIDIESETAIVYGYVKVEDRKGKQEYRNWVQVTMYNQEGVAVAQCKSDEDGRYQFDKVVPGEYTIVAETTEMRPDKKKKYDRNHKLTGYAYISVTEAKAYQLEDIVLYEENDEEATISGKVTAQGESQACEVILKNVFHAEVAKCTTKNNGKYSFLNVKDGLYFIFARTESDGMGLAMVVVRNGKVYGETDIRVYKTDKLKQMEEDFMSVIEDCQEKEDAEGIRDRIAEEKKKYDGLSEKEKKQLSKDYVERLNELVELLSDVTYKTEDGVSVEQGGLVVSGEELEEGSSVEYELNVTIREAVSEKENEEVKTKEDYIQHSMEDAAGDHEIKGYYDIEMTKTVDGKEQEISDVPKDADTTGKFRVTIEIPEEERGYNHYSMVHEHHGKTEVLTDLDDNPDTITIEVDSFSTFALVATDKELSMAVEDDVNFKFSGVSLYLQDSITVCYKVDSSLFENKYTNPYVKFLFNGTERVVSGYTVQDDGMYVFEFAGVAPQQINDTIYATLCAELNGEIVESAVLEYSVATYCYKNLASDVSDAETVTLLVDLLNYGAAAQMYTGYKEDALANAELTDQQKSWATEDILVYESVQDTAYKTVEAPEAVWRGAALLLQDAVTLRYKIAAESCEGLTMKVEADGETWYIPGTEFEEINGGYYIYFNGLNASQMSVPVYTTLYNGDTAVSNTLCYSIESYVATRRNAADARLKELLDCLMKYGQSAYEYKN